MIFWLTDVTVPVGNGGVVILAGIICVITMFSIVHICSYHQPQLMGLSMRLLLFLHLFVGVFGWFDRYIGAAALAAAFQYFYLQALTEERNGTLSPTFVEQKAATGGTDWWFQLH